MEETKRSMKNAMTYGLYVGLALVIVHLMQYLMDVYQPSKWVSILTYLIMAGGIAMGTIYFRNQELNGYISYGKALGQGILIGICASIIFGFYFGLLTGVIDTTYMASLSEVVAEAYLDAGMDYDQVEMMMGMVKKYQTPFLMTISQILGNTITFIVFSLITSIFIKKEEPFFDTNE
ncbi:MAG: DUF4199 domain-containing protein [Bacteroidales bacterium]|jgi:uncharacterized protein involved in cysteine biosynthesis|nr:DUF4199 domain-containing protein [Bacteroidales bacterium]MDD4672337.1 DUF4199 domain-containing protein [Bacteroidales bacterium]MDY0347861.1 DUF4199 domain-containing protein [Tenuifilaceae bacterium]